MPFVISIRSWRARRKERKADQLIALAGDSPKDAVDAARAAQENVDRGFGVGPGVPSHAGEEGKKHH
jgi:hypothetical protein